MRYWIAKAAIEAREHANRKQVHVAAEASRDQSTIARFENVGNGRGDDDEEQVGWPRDVDETVAAYAGDLGIEPRALWGRALELWAADAKGVSPPPIEDL